MAALLTLVLLVGGCSGSVDAERVRRAYGPLDGISVTGLPGERPAVRVAAPVAVPATTAQVVVAGTGDPIRADQLFVLHLELYNARTGERAASTYDVGKAPIVAKTTGDLLFPALTENLLGLRQGSRLVLALKGADAYGLGGTPPTGVLVEDPVVLVADVLAVPPTTLLESATGRVLAPPTGGPQVRFRNGHPDSVGVGTSRRPETVTVVELIAGAGPEVRSPSLVTVDFLAQEWRVGADPFESTYTKDPVVVPVGTEGSIPAWDGALVGLRAGSRVLVTAPYAQARLSDSVGIDERATIAWVIDILGAS